jgi:hypothetical protein
MEKPILPFVSMFTPLSRGIWQNWHVPREQLVRIGYLNDLYMYYLYPLLFRVTPVRPHFCHSETLKAALIAKSNLWNE